MKRGDVFSARLNPVEGSEQAGTRPVVVVSRDAINAASPVVIIVPCTSYRTGKRIYPSQVILGAPEGGLKADSIVLCEQVRAISKSRLVSQWGSLPASSMQRIDQALLIVLDLEATGLGPW
ncbi:MAG: type II toxin-antitoxin system PemK/MazF family toxin [Acidobacteriota bacterium]